MADNAFEWATKHSLVRVNPMHQEQEARLVLEDSFSFSTTEGETVDQSTSLQVEDPLISYMACVFDISKKNQQSNTTVRTLMANSWAPSLMSDPTWIFSSAAQMMPESHLRTQRL